MFAMLRQSLPPRVHTVTPAMDEQDFKLRVGERLTKLRLAAGYSSQGKLADKINTHLSTVQRWETGYSSPDAWDLRIVAPVLGVTAESLIWVEDEIEYLPADATELKVRRIAEATLAREFLKRQVRRRGRRGGPAPDAPRL